MAKTRVPEQLAASPRSFYDLDMSEVERHSSALEEIRSLAEFRYLLRRFVAFSEHAAESHGIPPQQHQLLLQIAGAAPGTEVTPTYLAARMSLRRHSVVELCNRCQAGGLLERRDSPDDGRSVTLHLTPKGEDVLTRLSQAHAAELRQLGPALVRALVPLLEPGEGQAQP